MPSSLLLVFLAGAIAVVMWSLGHCVTMQLSTGDREEGVQKSRLIWRNMTLSLKGAVVHAGISGYGLYIEFSLHHTTQNALRNQ